MIKVNTKGGNRPVRGRYGPLTQGGKPKPIIVYAYGDCLAIAFKKEEESLQSHSAKIDLLPSLHGREIMAAIGLAKG